MKRTLLTLFAFVALTGILNCTLIEPVFACKDEAAHSEQSGNTDCCFIHCSMHHQWISSDSLGIIYSALQAVDFLPFDGILQHDSPVSSIFHPPQLLK